MIKNILVYGAAILSTIIAIIAAVLFALMFIGIVTFQFNITALSLSIIFAIFAYIFVRIIFGELFDKSFKDD